MPGLALLGAYDWAAFGAPWHNPLSYSVTTFQGVTMGGTAGVHAPTLHSALLVFGSSRGLLVASPVLAAAAAGLWLLWRRGLRAEALLCAAVTVAFILGECGYGNPYGGRSPGPRYLVAALPFLSLGLAPMFERRWILTTVLAAISLVAMTTLMLTWQLTAAYRDTVWGEIGRVFTQQGSSLLVNRLTKDVLVWGPNRTFGAAVVAALVATAFVVAVRSEPRS